MTKVKADKPVLNFNSKHLIPAACHYNENTILTKDGQLIQILQIKNVFNLGNKITGAVNVREILRQAIQKHVNTDKIAFWISTVRDVADLSDHGEFQIPFCKDLHDAWQEKNNWNNHFVNTLYISIAYQRASLDIENFSSFVNSLSDKIVGAFHDSYLSQGLTTLNQIVNNIYDELKIFNVKKLAIINEDGTYYCELQSFLSRLIYFEEKKIPIDEVDISESLSPLNYEVGASQIEITKNHSTVFACMLSLKEYQEMPPDVLDEFLQLPIGMIVTEIFMIVKKKTAVKDLEFNNYILSLSHDEDFANSSSAKEMITQSGEIDFCKQQINISIMAKGIKTLDDYAMIAAKKLADIGIVIVKEDVDIEYAFWARLPGNSHLLKRTSYILKKYTAAFASLSHFPPGNMVNKWGDAVTILKTSKNTPYFFNFHLNEVGHTCLIGGKDDGKTTLLNFLLAMATKYNPDICYITDSNKTSAFIDILGGDVLDHSCLPNPLLCLSQGEILEWLKIVCGNRAKKLQDNEVTLLSDVVKYLLSLPKEERLLNKVEEFDFSAYQDSIYIKSRLMLFCPQGAYADIKFNNTIDLKESKITSFNLSFFTEASFKARNYPKQENLVPEYLLNLDIHNQVRGSILLMLFKIFCQKDNQNPKILALLNLDNLVPIQYISQDLYECCDLVHKNNGIVLSSINTQSYDAWDSTEFWNKLRSFFATKIVLASEDIMPKTQSFIGFSKEEMALLLSLPHKGRFFAISQSDFTISAELNLIAYPTISKILTQDILKYNTYQKIKQTTPTKDNLLQKLYEEFKED